MEQNNDSGDASRAGIATNRVDAAVAVVLLVIGATVIYESQRLGFRWASDGPEAGYFPFYIGLILSLSAAATLFQALLSKYKNTEIFVDGTQLKQVMAVLVPATVYVLAIQLLGIYIASAVYIALFMIVLGKYSWIKSLVIAVLVNTVFFLMFEVWFKVPLYKGEFDLLRFLGY